MKKILLSLYSTLLFTPMVGFAASQKTVLDLIGTVYAILKQIGPLIMSLAVIYFVWGLMQYLTKEGEDRAKAKDAMVWGIVILFVMVSVWSLVGILRATVF